MNGLSKSRLLMHIQCPKRLWLQINKPDEVQENSGMSKRLGVGTHVGVIAQSQFENGVVVTTDDLIKGLSDTKIRLKEASIPLFEAAFNAEGLLVLADLLIPNANGWRMAEVKSSASVKDYHITDATIQSWVVKHTGLPLDRIEIAHIDTSFVYPGNDDYSGLFYYADISEEVETNLPLVREWIDSAKSTLSGDEPDILPGTQCNKPFDCPFYSYCSEDYDEQEEFPVEILPYGSKIAQELREEGYCDLRDVPEDRLTNAKHKRVWTSTINNQVILDEEGVEEVRQLKFPRYYIDFETIQMAIPIWAGTRPYSQIPFQWSCHVEFEDGSLEHYEFLADGKSDPRRHFIETLLESVGKEGPVIVYNVGFERTRLKELAEYYDDLANEINDVIDRLFDLLPIARQYYYHPQMMGSWSIKAVLPTIAPELAYDDLEVGDGGMAMEAFSEMMNPDITDERHKQLFNALLKYCERDTFAMVAIAKYFEGRD